MPEFSGPAFDFVTDTATLCISDPAALKHRFDDDADWWSLPEDEIAEVNAGNVAFIGLGSDGRFRVWITDFRCSGTDGVTLKLNCPSGKVFIGAGEEVTSGGFEPELVRGGHFHVLPSGCYRVRVRRGSGDLLEIAFSQANPPARNEFSETIRLNVT